MWVPHFPLLLREVGNSNVGISKSRVTIVTAPDRARTPEFKCIESSEELKCL
jgi:hypothetical protein